MPQRRIAPCAVSCDGKERMSAGRAVLVAKQMRRRHHDARIGAYRCEHCDGWHVGNHSARTIARPGGKGGQDDDDDS